VYAPGRERKLSRYFHFALGSAVGCMTAAMMAVAGVGPSDPLRGQVVEGLQARRCSEDVNTVDGVKCKRASRETTVKSSPLIDWQGTSSLVLVGLCTIWILPLMTT
jgi:hypothetical protein